MTSQVETTNPAFVESMTQFFDGNPDSVDEEQLKQAIQNALEKTKTKTTSETTRRGRRATKEPRDPNLPKRPKNAYMLFTDSIREEVKAALIQEAPDGKIRVSDIAKVCGERWKTLTEGDKQPFVDANTEAKVTYDKAMEDYYEQYPDKKVEKATKKAGGGKKRATKAKKAAFSTEDGLPTTPEGFSGAYTGYLKGSVKDPETGKNILKKFADFNEAVVEAIRLGDACGGITRTTKGYSLRSGKDVKTNSSAGEGIEISWVKGDGSDIDASVVTATTEPAHEPAPESVSEPESAPSDNSTDFDAETDDEGPPPLEEPEPEPETEPTPEVEVASTQENTTEIAEVAEVAEDGGDNEVDEPDDDDDDDDDDEDNDVDAEEWVWKGVTYFVDADNDVMTEEGDVVGKRVKIGGKLILKKC
jgi:hypothetical protein